MKYRAKLPQLDDHPFLTDSGLETTLIFHDGVDLPFMASITLHATALGESRGETIVSASWKPNRSLMPASS